jgi:phosphatidylinositol alpha-1,6-mannosyltransferase
MKHLLVTNDFPPKIGGIQSLLWEWWRRLPPDEFAVLTSPYRGAAEFDAEQPFLVERVREPVLLPHPLMVHRTKQLAARFGAEFVVLDPAVPLGLIGPSLDLPYDVIVHGAEVTVPGRLPATRQALGHVLRNARQVIAGGEYAAGEAERAAGRSLATTIVPPGVDVTRFHPLDDTERAEVRTRLGLPVDARLIVGVSRLVPRKGFDTAIRAVAELHRRNPREYADVHLVIAGRGRDAERLQKLARELGAPVTFLGRVAHADLPRLYACGDVFTMLCRNRWGGLEQEGFGIVFVEAAACGVAQVAGDSGGAAEAVAHGETGLVVDADGECAAVTAADAFAELLDDPVRRAAMGRAARRRAEAQFDYDVLAPRLRAALAAPPVA